MPKVSERINKMAQIMCDCCDDNGKCWDNHLCTNINIQDCRYKENAEQLIKAGYVHISDCENTIKQAQIDVLNKLTKKTHNYYSSIDSYCISQHVVLVRDIDELIKEVETPYKPEEQHSATDENISACNLTNSYQGGKLPKTLADVYGQKVVAYILQKESEVQNGEDKG